MFNFDFGLDYDFFSKRWPTKTGYFFAAIAITFLVLTLEYLLKSVCNLTISNYLTVLFILLALLIHDVLWRFSTGRVIFLFFNKIIIAMHPNVLKEYKDLKKILTSLIKERQVGGWFKVIILPEDLVLDECQKAERYLVKQGLNLLIWGESISGQEQGKDVTQYRLKFSYIFNYPVHNPSAKALLIRDFDELLKERYWKVHKENSLQEISSLGESITEIGLYIIAICLLTRGNIGKGLNILEDLFIRIKNDPIRKKLLICPKIKNHLISLYNLLGIIAWKEEKNKTKSVELANKTLALDENNYDSHARLALYEYQEGNIPESKRHVRRCRHIYPKHPCTIFDQAFYFILEKKYSNAAIAYKKLNQATVDGLMAFEVANFLEEEYSKKKKEIGFLFAAGFVNTKFVPHTKLGLKQLKEFCRLSENKAEYIDFYNLAKGSISNYSKELPNV